MFWCDDGSDNLRRLTSATADTDGGVIHRTVSILLRRKFQLKSSQIYLCAVLLKLKL